MQTDWIDNFLSENPGWLEHVVYRTGPNGETRSLQEPAAVAFGEWAYRKGLIDADGLRQYLAALHPPDVN